MIIYQSNNSGGYWWLTDQDWLALEAAGWKVKWYRDQRDMQRYLDSDGSCLGALACSATRSGLSLDASIAEFERITGKSAELVGRRFESSFRHQNQGLRRRKPFSFRRPTPSQHVPPIRPKKRIQRYLPVSYTHLDVYKRQVLVAYLF